jgi:hypothetical protein
MLYKPILFTININKEKDCNGKILQFLNVSLQESPGYLPTHNSNYSFFLIIKMYIL